MRPRGHHIPVLVDKLGYSAPARLVTYNLHNLRDMDMPADDHRSEGSDVEVESLVMTRRPSNPSKRLLLVLVASALVVACAVGVVVVSATASRGSGITSADAVMMSAFEGDCFPSGNYTTNLDTIFKGKTHVPNALAGEQCDTEDLDGVRSTFILFASHAKWIDGVQFVRSNGWNASCLLAGDDVPTSAYWFVLAPSLTKVPNLPDSPEPQADEVAAVNDLKSEQGDLGLGFLLGLGRDGCRPIPLSGDENPMAQIDKDFHVSQIGVDEGRTELRTRR